MKILSSPFNELAETANANTSVNDFSLPADEKVAQSTVPFNIPTFQNVGPYTKAETAVNVALKQLDEAPNESKVILARLPNGSILVSPAYNDLNMANTTSTIAAQDSFMNLYPGAVKAGEIEKDATGRIRLSTYGGIPELKMPAGSVREL